MTNTVQYKDVLTSRGVIEPETISMLFPDLSGLERQKLQVMWLLYNTRSAYEDMDVFEKVV